MWITRTSADNSSTRKARARWRRRRLRDVASAGVLALVAPLIAAVGLLSVGVGTAHADPQPIDGSASDCQPWLETDLFNIKEVVIAEEGWVWANGEGTTDKFRDAEGVVTKSKVAHNDTPANHYSHDWNVDFRVDAEYRGLLSNVNGPNGEGAVGSVDDLLPAEKIELEWETGVLPDETSGDGASPFLPRWVLPSLGDRVWTNGHWVFDCGHEKKVGGVNHFRTEIHPGRAIASMRQQALPVPGSGTTPVPVTATDLYVHGRGAYMVQQLECGIDIIVQLVPTSCPVENTAIAALYEFDVCLPPKISDHATLSWAVTAGPGDSGKGGNPTITRVAPATGGCTLAIDEFFNDFDNGVMLHVTVDLRSSGIAPTDVYARRIVAGWVEPPATPLKHLALTLDQLDLHQDHEADPFDGEFTFWWMNVDRAPSDEWYRLVNYEIPTHDDSWSCFEHTNVLNDMDDDQLCLDGLLNFSGPTWDFYLRNGDAFTINSSGFEQDCYDDWFGFVNGGLAVFLAAYIDCHFGNVLTEFTNDWGNNDAVAVMEASIGGPSELPVEPGEYRFAGNDGEFHFEYTLGEIPLTNEDTADLSVDKTCTWEGEVALAGRPIDCTILVENAGPGLPRNVVVTDTLTSGLGAADLQVGQARFHVGSATTTYACGASTANGFTCAIGTVPVDGSVTIDVQIVPAKPGKLTNAASVSTDSTDPTTSDDSDSVEVDVFLPVPVDIQPGGTPNTVNVTKQGVVTVAIITTPTFSATSLAIATACFGDAEAPDQRSCDEVHHQVHAVDADRDKDVDLVFHFQGLATGIDLGDTKACLKGTTTDGNGFYGCDSVRPV